MLAFIRRSMIARLLGLAAVAVFTGGAQSSCSGSSGDPTVDEPAPIPIVDDDLGSGNGPNFTSTLVLRNSAGAESYRFTRAELITFEFTVRNHSALPVTLSYTGVPASAFVFYSGGSMPIWDPFHGQVFAQVISTTTLAAGETRVFSFPWNQVLADGGMLQRGNYQARGVFLAPGVFGPNSDYLYPHELGSNLRSFTIR
jgi:hypothetical protein